MGEEGLVVDCDSHVMEPPELWQEYLEPRFRDRAIRIEEESEELVGPQEASHHGL